MREHIVKPGECMVSIGALYKMAWESLWDLEENRDLRELRKQPGILAPGDVVCIPPSTHGRTRVSAGGRYVFEVLITTTEVRLEVVRNSKRWVNQPVALKVGDFRSDGVTDGEGVVTFSVPADAREGFLLLREGTERYRVRFGHLDPMDRTSGLQARLRGLGYYYGKIDDVMGPWTRRALRSFQRDKGLEVTSDPDPTTCAALEEEFGS